jgi:electron transport complex protein RnfG
MKKYFKTSMVLAIICACAAIILAFLNSLTQPVIIEYEYQKTLSALEAVSDGLLISEENSLVENNSFVNYYYVLSEDNVKMGYLLNLDAVGYGGKISMVASYNKEGQVMQAKVVSNTETPGLGKKCEESWYMNKYLNKSKIPNSKTQLNGDDADAISGASITFIAIANALRSGSDFVKSLGGK